MWVVCDIETNGLENCNTIWCIVCKDIDTGERYEFIGPDYGRFISFASSVDCWIGHFFLGFDAPTINRLFNQEVINPSQVIDTLVVSRLANFAQWSTEGKPSPLKHGLDAWGERFGLPKLHPDISFDHYSPELLERCIQDVEITGQIYNHYKSYIHDPLNQEALRIEHESQLICNDIHNNGFSFDIDRAIAIHSELCERITVLTNALQEHYPPQSYCIREISPKQTKHGTIHRGDFRWVDDGNLTPYSAGAPFSRIGWKEFNPGSSKDRVEALNKASWTPVDKTDGHIKAEENHKQWPTKETKEKLDHYKIYGWKTSEDNLATLPADAPEPARKLVQWLLLDGRRSTLEEWFRAYDPTTERIHGTYTPIGSWTQRKAHSAPNMANTPSKNSKYNGEELKELAKEFGIKLRSCFVAPPNRLLIGTDADGIQGRIFAHYINDKDFIKALIEGDSKLGTDIHSRHHDYLQPYSPDRSNAKTFYYAWLLGAGVTKVANIFGCSHGDAKKVIKIFLDIYPGLGYLKKSVIPNDARRGYFIGFDGRIVPCPSEYYMLAGYLQNGESVIMKHAASHWRKRLTKENIWFKQVNDVHDEWQTEVEADMDLANYIGSIQADSIRIVAENFNLNCPFKGNYKIGLNWNDTH